MKYQKKPVIIDAWQVPDRGEQPEEALVELVQAQGWEANDDGIVVLNEEYGTLLAKPNDWIIRGVEGEFYPCPPSVFAETYEAVPDA